jgi:hypothetical protein
LLRRINLLSKDEFKKAYVTLDFWAHRINPLNWYFYFGESREEKDWFKFCPKLPPTSTLDLCLISILEDALRDGCLGGGGLVGMGDDSYFGKKFSCKGDSVCLRYSRGASELRGESEWDSTRKCIQSGPAELFGIDGLVLRDFGPVFALRNYLTSGKDYLLTVSAQNKTYFVPMKDWAFVKNFVDAFMGLNLYQDEMEKLLKDYDPNKEPFSYLDLIDGMHY